MYIDHISRRPSIREATRFETVQAKNVNIKKLKMLDKNSGEAVQRAKYHGGRLYLGKGFGSWLKRNFRRVGNFAKSAFNKVIKPTYSKIIKPGLNFLTKTELGKQITDAGSKIIGSAVSAIPVVGPIAGPVVANTLPTVVNAADSVTSAAENIVKGIKEKNPQVTTQQAKDIVKTIQTTYNTLKDEAKAVKEEQTKKALEALPDTIKAEGFEAVAKAAPFLPLIDLTTLKVDTSQKGGKIKQVYKVRKPSGCAGLKYSPTIVARVAGRMFMAGKAEPVESSENSSLETSKAEPVETSKPKNNKKAINLLEQLRLKYK